jgi:hypothetical protein
MADEMQNTKIKILSFKIPIREDFPEEYRNGSIEVGVVPKAWDSKEEIERLKEWTIENILLGFIEKDYDEAYLVKEEIFIRVLNQEGHILLDTFFRGTNLIYRP